MPAPLALRIRGLWSDNLKPPPRAMAQVAVEPVFSVQRADGSHRRGVDALYQWKSAPGPGIAASTILLVGFPLGGAAE